MQAEFRSACRAAGALALVFLCACSGGSDGEASRTVQVSTKELSFAAEAPNAAAPASQVITATFGAGVANVAALHSGPAIERVDVSLNGTTAQLTVVPAVPSTLGAGSYKSTIAVTAYFCGDAGCTRLEAGHSETITASYQVSPLVTLVAPNVGVAGESGTAIIRGLGFDGFAVQGVNFGTTPAESFTLITAGELQATYPALSAGTYPILLDVPTHTGPVPTQATLTIIDPVISSAQALAWPTPPTTIYSVEYDAVNGALLATSDAGGGELVRYGFSSGAWQAPTSAALAGVRDAALSTDGSQWIAITTTEVTHVNPATLEVGTKTPAPSLPENAFLKTIAVLNTNQAFITTGIDASELTPLYGYNVAANEIGEFGVTFNNGTVRGSRNGTTVGIILGDPSLTDAPAFWLGTTGGTPFPTGIALLQNGIYPAFNLDATRFVLNGTRVYSAETVLLGTLPETSAAVVLRPDGKRAYTFDTSDGTVRVFDISETNEGEAYEQLGDPVVLAGAPGASVRMAISPDGGTLFIAGAAQLVIQPTPAL